MNKLFHIYGTFFSLPLSSYFFHQRRRWTRQQESNFLQLFFALAFCEKIRHLCAKENVEIKKNNYHEFATAKKTESEKKYENCFYFIALPHIKSRDAFVRRDAMRVKKVENLICEIKTFLVTFLLEKPLSIFMRREGRRRSGRKKGNEGEKGSLLRAILTVLFCLFQLNFEQQRGK